MRFSTIQTWLAGVLVVAGAVGWQGIAQADQAKGDAARGAKVAYTCLGCHGIAEYRNSYPNYHVPKIGGQNAEYIVAALGEYHAGARKHPTMRAQASSMTDQSMLDIAAYLASDTPLRSKTQPVANVPKTVQNVCAACHGLDGIAALPAYPNLAGQQADYIEQALRAYKSGARQNAVMNGMSATIADEEIPLLARYYANQSPGLWVPKAAHH
jgi:cytochrome c553